MDWLTPYLTQTNGVLAFIAGLVIVAIYWKPLTQWWNSRKPVTTIDSTSTDPDVADMLALKRLDGRFKRLGCKEGVAAMQVAGQNFFHEHPEA